MANKNIKGIYNRAPVLFHDGIPVFSAENDYTKNYESISNDHLDHFFKHGNNPFIEEDVWVQMEESTLALVNKYSKPDDMILDVGVGLGRLLSNFPNLRRYGIDISYGYLHESKNKGIEVCYALIEDMPYENNIFDIVVCTDVLEHVLDLNMCVSKILSTLKAGGFLIVRVPYREILATYLETSYKYVHLRNFDEYSLRLLFEKIFDCEYIETSFGPYVALNRYFKYHIPIIGEYIFTPFINIIKHLSPPVSERLTQLFYNPLEINIVYKKK